MRCRNKNRTGTQSVDRQVAADANKSKRTSKREHDQINSRLDHRSEERGRRELLVVNEQAQLGTEPIGFCFQFVVNEISRA